MVRDIYSRHFCLQYFFSIFFRLMSSIIIIPHARLFFYVPFLFPRPRLIMDFLPIFIYAWFFENRVSKDEDSFYYLAIKNNENLAK